MIFEIISGGEKTDWVGKEWAGLFFPRGKNGPAHSFPGEKTDWGEIPACYTGSSIRYKLACHPVHTAKIQISLRIRTVWSEASFSPWKKTLDPWLPIEGPMKTVIRLCGCAGRSESFIGTHANWYLFAGLRLIPSHLSPTYTFAC